MSQGKEDVSEPTYPCFALHPADGIFHRIDQPHDIAAVFECEDIKSEEVWVWDSEGGRYSIRWNNWRDPPQLQRAASDEAGLLAVLVMWYESYRGRKARKGRPPTEAEMADLRKVASKAERTRRANRV